MHFGNIREDYNYSKRSTGWGVPSAAKKNSTTKFEYRIYTVALNISSFSITFE
jgi:hypothetical protein